ncbi:MAG TPA: hypothetical protein PKD27_11455 [Tepidiformaceae bacterium]|nr:hypothetical protein [Tepidiformaceae bacterium]
MDTIWASDFRVIPAAFLTVAGAWLLVVGIAWGARSLRAPYTMPGKNLLLMRGMRRLIWGLSFVAIGLGWYLQWPVMVAAGLIFAFEETNETSIAAWALKQEADGRPGFADA